LRETLDDERAPIAMTKPPILLSGYFGFGNLGDEAILEGLVAELRRREPEAAIAAISGDPGATRARLSIEAVDFHDLDAIDRAVAGSRRVLFGLGGVFQDYWGALTTSLFREKTVGVEAYARPAMLAALHGVPHALFAAGVGPLTTEAGRRFFAMACRGADALVVRDEASAEAVRSSGVLAPVSIGADAAFLLEAAKADSEKVHRRLASVGLVNAPFLAFALRHWDFSSSPEAEIVAHAARVARGLPAGWKAVFVPFHRGAGTDDAAVATRAAAACGDRGLVIDAGSPGELIALLDAPAPSSPCACTP
jgi:polysaccharide pyruvyl transferase WcaK-like protein